MHLLLMGLSACTTTPACRRIISHAKQFSHSSIKRSHASYSLQCAHWAGGLVFPFSVSLFVFWINLIFLLFLSLLPLSLYPLYLSLPVTDFHPFLFSLATFIPSIIAHLFEKASDWGLRSPDRIVIREWDRR